MNGDHMSLGQDLYVQFLQDVTDHDWDAVEATLAPAFQSVHADGVRDRDQEIAMIKAEHAHDITATDFSESQVGDTLVVTHLLAVNEVIDGNAMSTDPAPRLTVWHKNGEKWQIIAIASLNVSQGD